MHTEIICLIFISVFKNSYTHIYTYIHIYIYTHVHVYLYIYTHVHVYIYTHINIYVFYLHTYIFIYVQVSSACFPKTSVLRCGVPKKSGRAICSANGCHSRQWIWLVEWCGFFQCPISSGEFGTWQRAHHCTCLFHICVDAPKLQHQTDIFFLILGL